MLQRSIRCSTIAAIVSLLSVAVLISSAQFDVAQAQTGRAAAIACGEKLKQQCSGVTEFGTNMLDCLKKDRDKLPKRCAAMANNLMRKCDRDAARRCQGNVAGQGSVIDCLTIARRSVSARCNAALDAAYLR
jgi:Cysteine rich repeat